MEHIVKSFDEELEHLAQDLARMGALAERQLALALTALEKADNELAAEVVANDRLLDELEREIQHQAVRVLALRQPMAADLRHVIGALKISGALERIGDYAANVAKRSQIVTQATQLPDLTGILKLGRLVETIINDVQDAFNSQDATKAVHVWMRDEEVDEGYSQIFTTLVAELSSNKEDVTAISHLMFISKNIERIGDHATNIAETLHYMVQGTAIPGERPKASGISEH